MLEGTVDLTTPTHVQPIERYLRRPAASQLDSPSRRPVRQHHEPPSPGRAQHEADTARRRSQERDRQCVIIAAQHGAGNGE